MTVITFRKSDLEKLVGTKLSHEELRQILSRLKGEIEQFTEDEIQLEVTHDRPDLFSVEGIARTLKGLLEIELGAPKLDVKYGTYTLQVENVPHRPYILTCIVRDVELDDEAIRQLMQLQEKLHQTYGRDRKYFAIGLYDADKIKFPITYKLCKVTEVFYTPLGYNTKMSGKEVLEKTEKGQKYGNLALYEDKVPIIVDSTGEILVIIPILNSEEHKVTPDTKNIMIDVTAIDLRYAMDTMRVLIYNIAERSKSKIIEIPEIRADYGSVIKNKLLEYRNVNLSLNYIRELTGIDFSIDSVEKYLLMSRHDVERVSDSEVLVKVPPFRINVLHPVDLVEDVLIAYGYYNVVPEYPAQAVHGRKSTRSRFVELIRQALIGLGFNEVMTYILTSRELLKKCKQDNGVIELLNPKSELFNCVRTCIWPILLEYALKNEAYISEQLKLFDIGEVAFVRDGALYQEERIGLLITGRKVTLTDGLVTLKTLAKVLGVKFTYERTTVPGLIPERTAKVLVNNVEVGYVGEVHPEVLEDVGFTYPTVVIELSLDKLLGIYTT